MKLRPAPGGPEMINALSDQNVRDIVTMLLQVMNQEAFRNFANFLVKFTTRTQVNFTEALEDLRISFQSYPDAQGFYLTPEAVNACIDRLKALYQQNEKIVGYLRGAILERLTSELIAQRCYAGECQSNQKFLDEHGREVTAQIDVVVLSHNNLFAEGYECKIKVDGLTSEDCNNLKALVRAARNEDYYVHVGITSFVSDKLIKRRLEHFNAPPYITAYGLNSITRLRNTPHYIDPAGPYSDDTIQQ